MPFCSHTPGKFEFLAIFSNKNPGHILENWRKKIGIFNNFATIFHPSSWKVSVIFRKAFREPK
jgi:hypothetical protein